ncbi:NAD(P)/FAD-dependent oxidoreductase [Modestobacter roseus]|uniref:3-phenylpropionate/trans-cinnamate dioxygenase ferredoxin reductase subunit n=1 Tax=Modestobacter roseus TaxID=1181884 RepID=A0A562IQ80_9ACTN|nr:FAD-dependent oxidoreductase [Modestobacter roseus]TWH72754.1 3-phenylpropionate/trans-cinnamate dioxygenase ferredoxin reductase subunit [Modestobacter roseus]
MQHVVVIGAGHAGVQVAESLRTGGHDGRVTLVGDEDALPYQRPPLSKDFLAPGDTAEPLPLRGARFYAENGIDLRTGVTATVLDRRRRTVVLDDGDELHYSALVLATGAANRTLAVTGSDLAGVHDLRTLADAERLRADLEQARSAAVVGAGFIGLEFAAAARARGLAVTVLETTDRPMGRALTADMSTHLADAHRAMGSDLRLGEGLAGIRGRDGRVTGLVSGAGAEYAADVVLIGVGVRPRDELATAAGLVVDDGIVVDAHLRTSDPDVYAIGDCASFPIPGLGGRRRLESVQNATDQGRHVAQQILGAPAGYGELPWFWSNQGSLRLQIAGLAQPGDTTVVCGDRPGGRFSVLAFRDGALVAVESLNRAADHVAARRVLSGAVTPTPEQAADPAFSLKDFAKQSAPVP